MWAIGYVTLYILSLLLISVFLRVTYEPTASLFQPYYFGVVLFCSINALYVILVILLTWKYRKVGTFSVVVSQEG